jgi:hypothetical protein
MKMMQMNHLQIMMDGYTAIINGRQQAIKVAWER